jgi:hypothetical protein
MDSTFLIPLAIKHADTLRAAMLEGQKNADRSTVTAASRIGRFGDWPGRRYCPAGSDGAWGRTRGIFLLSCFSRHLAKES